MFYSYFCPFNLLDYLLPFVPFQSLFACFKVCLLTSLVCVQMGMGVCMYASVMFDECAYVYVVCVQCIFAYVCLKLWGFCLKVFMCVFCVSMYECPCVYVRISV